MDKSAGLGAAAGAAGGCLVVIGAVLPWQNFVFPGGPVPGCFGCGAGPLAFPGSQLGNGKLALYAGLVTALASLLLAAYPAARQWLAVTLAAAVVVAAAAAGGWWLKQMPAAVATAGIIEACGVMLGLAAVPLCLPGPVRERASFLAAVVLLCVAGVFLARPESTAVQIVF